MTRGPNRLATTTPQLTVALPTCNGTGKMGNYNCGECWGKGRKAGPHPNCLVAIRQALAALETNEQNETENSK